MRIFRLFAALVLCMTLLPFRVSAEEAGFEAVFTYTGNHALDDVNNDLYTYQGKTYAYVNAWKNDEVHLKIAVTSDSSCSVSASVSELVSPTGAVLETSSGFLKYADGSWGYGTNAAPRISVPEIITDEKTAEVNAGQVQYYWIDIPVGKDAENGMYHASVILSNGSTERCLSLGLYVYDLTVPEEGPSLNFWQYPFSSLYYYDCLEGEEPFSEKHLAVLKKELEIYRDMGGRSITAAITDEPWSHQTYYDTPSLVTWNRDNKGFIWFDYSRFDAWVQLCMDMGIDERIDCFSILPFDNSITLIEEDGHTKTKVFLTVGSYEWDLDWNYFIVKFIEHLEEKGWFDKTYIFVDERGIADFPTAINVIRSNKNSEGKTLKIASAVNVIPRDQEIYDQIDYLSISIASVPEGDAAFDSFTEHRRQLGLDTTLYNCSTNYPNAFVYSDPDESVWTMLYEESLGFDGYLRWAYNAWNEDPLNSLDYTYFESGDILLIYPDERTSQDPVPYSTVRLEMIEQGLNDVRKLQYLQSHLEDDSVRQLLVSQLGSLKRAYGVYNAYGSMVAKNDAGRRTITAGALHMEDMIRKISSIQILMDQDKNYQALHEAALRCAE